MCIFCQIINGEIPSSVVYEDEKTIAILDISQVTKGHTLVIPKKHYENLFELEDEEAIHYFKVVKKLSEEIYKKTNAKGLNILNNTNEIAGQTVNHLHFHIIPRYDENDALSINFGQSEKLDLASVLALLK